MGNGSLAIHNGPTHTGLNVISLFVRSSEGLPTDNRGQVKSCMYEVRTTNAGRTYPIYPNLQSRMTILRVLHIRITHFDPLCTMSNHSRSLGILQAFHLIG